MEPISLVVRRSCVLGSSHHMVVVKHLFTAAAAGTALTGTRIVQNVRRVQCLRIRDVLNSNVVIIVHAVAGVHTQGLIR